MGNVRKRLLSTQILQALSRQVVKWLRFAVESVLKSGKEGTVRCAYHEWVKAILPDRAGILTADVEEDWRVFVIRIKILRIDPVSLLVCADILIVIIINQCVFRLFLKIVN